MWRKGTTYTDEGGELFVGFGVSELCSPTVVEFQETGMGLVTKDDLGITTGLLPVAALLGFSGCERMFVIVPFVLDEDFVWTGTTHLSCERVMEMFIMFNV